VAARWFLKLDGITGESTHVAHKAEIDVEAWSFGVDHESESTGRGRAAGKAEFDDFHFVSRLSAASPPLLLACATWIRDHPTPELYLRQVDVPGVDTKFLESNASILSSLLDAVLPEERVDLRFSRSDIVGRYGFRRRPDYTRVRFLAPQTVLPAGLSELMFRTEELTRLDPQLGEVVIVENEISFLALPDRPDTLAVFGSGFALGSVAGLSWLQGKKIIYWGDLDTYGLVILNRLRARYPHVQSILMDVDTLLAHRSQWVREEVPTRIALPHLDEAESELYQALVEDRFGPQVRLEQERIRFSRVRAALAAVR